MLLYFAHRDELFRWLDGYAAERKKELDEQRLTHALGLPKAYLLETAGNNSPATAKALASLPWKVRPAEEEGLFFLQNGHGTWAVLEQLSDRHFALYTLLRHQDFERAFRAWVLGTPWWDFAWFAGIALNILWQDYLVDLYPERFTKLAFEHEAHFEPFGSSQLLAEGDSVESEEREGALNEDEDTFPVERRASVLSIGEQIGRIAHFLPQLQEIHAPFLALKMLRLPAAERGGYDLWSWGKLTFRAPSFREGRAYLLTMTRMYQQATETLEREAWIQAEPLPKLDGGIRLSGTPITFRFAQPLSLSAFHRFIEGIFGRARNLFRLWGNPIWRSERFAYVHGVDMHLWEPLGLELTPKYFRLYLLQGTCGNTVHRLARNLQRYVDPAVQVFVGEKPYEDLFRQALWDIAAGRKGGGAP